MFSKEEAAEIRKSFWTQFETKSGNWRRKQGLKRKWLLKRTGLKGLELKFILDKKSSQVAVYFYIKDPEFRLWYYEKWESMKKLFEAEVGTDWIWEKDYYLKETNQDIHRIYIELDQKVSIYNKNDWELITSFFISKMGALELFFEEYKEIFTEF